MRASRPQAALRAGAFAVAALSVLPACEPSVEEKLGPLRGPARAMAARFDPMRLDFAKQPPIAKNGADARGATFEKLPIGSSPHTEKGVAAIVYADELDHLGDRAPMVRDDAGAHVLANCAAWAKHGTTAPDDQGTVWDAVHVDYLARVLRDCARLTHVLVIRPLAFVEASPVRLDPATTNVTASYEICVPDAKTAPPGTRCVFDGAHMKVELHLYSLDPVRHLGGFVAEAESAPTHPFYSTSSFVSMARDDVRSKLERALEEGMKIHLHGALYR